MNLIALTGSMGCGKSTAIEMLRELYPNKDFVLVKFAQPLYDMQEMIYGRIASVYVRPSDFVKDRKLLQWIGTEWGRSINVDLWVSIWKAEVAAAIAKNPNAVIVCDDCRYDNEAEVIKGMGGKIVKIFCEKAQTRITTANGIVNHTSEAGISPTLVDHFTWNNSTLQDYKDSLNELYQRVNLVQG